MMGLLDRVEQDGMGWAEIWIEGRYNGDRWRDRRSTSSQRC